MAIPLEMQRLFQLKPLGLAEGRIRVAPLYPLSQPEQSALSAVEQGWPVEEVPMDRAEVLRYLRTISGSLFIAAADGDYASGFSSSLFEAIEAGASDIHLRLLNHDEGCHLRQRIHGYLQPPLPLEASVARRFLTWTKQMAGLDSSERQRPQEGRFSLFAHGVNVEFRVSCSGQSDGETMVIRILDPRRRLSLDHLMADPALVACLKQLVDLETKQGGLVLVSGPTGAGKTTTLAALTAALPLDRLKAVAIEDPVEIRTPGVDHIEVDAERGLGFAALLRAVLRQDPDIIVVGEIRDAETAEITLRAVETGHWVMASVHAGSVLETIYRLASLLPENYAALGRLTLQTRVRAVINQQLRPVQQGRQLHMEALFASGRQISLPWFEAGVRPETFSGCTYFPGA